MRFGPEDRLSRVENLLSTELDQETVLMSLDAGAYYGLEGPARTIWETLAAPMTFSALVARTACQVLVTTPVTNSRTKAVATARPTRWRRTNLPTR